ncbi:aminopeptidase P family protein [Antarcticibacterium flavum]|uniref:Aminopeptidase P family protein n=1 Tax=Antarcticibacterium flavum TaxID=2058175 RepID=A0A5B7X792_9FLAO|nr:MULTISPECIES: Xaa-Pro peptidase family protein [Antarcticibacterium]MCM4159693.1 X-Pro dipeptidase [Antarcticibacterium sp. W02-3]QCY70632.1 aminopeptidase P family protein [Antarcticibacterium flavum]
MNSNREYGIGGSTAAAELEKLIAPKDGPAPVPGEEFRQRLQKASRALQAAHLDALYINAGTNLYYFTGTRWNPSERLVGAVLFATGELHYIVPEFEIGTIQDYIEVEGEIVSWQEHESPTEKIAALLKDNSSLAVDDSTSFAIVSRLQETILKISSAEDLIKELRMVKSNTEITQLQYAMDLTIQVQKAAAAILRPGITTAEVEGFIHEAHKKLGIQSGSYFCIVLFGKDSSFPHGVKSPKALEEGDIVLVDTGCRYNGYLSDITRTYIYGTPSAYQKEIWEIEKSAQMEAFKAARLGATCGKIDEMVREHLRKNNLGSNYDLPGLPHRTGHGIGLDIHEHPYILQGNDIEIKQGFTFSIEPMIVVPGEFGIRLEDHIFLTAEGPKWFTQPAHTMEDPFGVEI